MRWRGWGKVRRVRKRSLDDNERVRCWKGIKGEISEGQHRLKGTVWEMSPYHWVNHKHSVPSYHPSPKKKGAVNVGIILQRCLDDSNARNQYPRVWMPWCAIEMRTVNIQTHFHVETLLCAAHARSWPDSRIVHLAQRWRLVEKNSRQSSNRINFCFKEWRLLMRSCAALR